MMSKQRNAGFTLIENLVSMALFSFLLMNLVIYGQRLQSNQATYKNMTMAAHIVESVAGEISVIGQGYDWLKSDKTHVRYFDIDGNETTLSLAKYTLQWTVSMDKPLMGMKIANFRLFWKEENKDQNLSFRVTR